MAFLPRFRGWRFDGQSKRPKVSDVESTCSGTPNRSATHLSPSSGSVPLPSPPRIQGERTSPHAGTQPEIAVSFVGVVRPPSRAGEYASSGCHHAETRTRHIQSRRRTQRVALLQCCTRRAVTAARQEPATERCEPLRRLGTAPGSTTDEMPRPTGRCRETTNENRAPDRRTHRQREAWAVSRRRIDPPPCHYRSLPRSLASPPCGSFRCLRG